MNEEAASGEESGDQQRLGRVLGEVVANRIRQLREGTFVPPPEADRIKDEMEIQEILRRIIGEPPAPVPPHQALLRFKG